MSFVKDFSYIKEKIGVTYNYIKGMLKNFSKLIC